MDNNLAVKRRRVGADQATRTRLIIQIGMLAAVATVLMLFEFPLPFAPSFYELDFSEVPVLIGSFAMGPLAGGCIELIKILLNLVVNGTDTMFVGELANLLMGCAMVIPAGFIYRRHKTRKTALAGMAAGTLCMAAAAVFVNAYMLLPAYGAAFHLETSAFVAMGQAIIPAVDSLLKFCLLIVTPFNLVKGIAVSVITLLLYKHISRLLKGRG
ncbi:MAG TPA: ECF transporter S component [Candidatus Scatomonas pullistercoris]|uniref:Riboflavin transporter n=1 Tax=Candidatus Scatomonas pullistercoris TaxID=2840920 RepID=A0A9D1P2L4_9FIRM|nr:ECF transporter S component [Candidatus Scatomonas pullistercoris]